MKKMNYKILIALILGLWLSSASEAYAASSIQITDTNVDAFSFDASSNISSTTLYNLSYSSSLTCLVGGSQINLSLTATETSTSTTTTVSQVSGNFNIDESCLVRDGITTNTINLTANLFSSELSTSTSFILAPPTPSTPSTTDVNVTIRYEDLIIFDGLVNIPATTTFTYHDSSTSTISTVDMGETNVLTAMIAAESASNGNFSLSDIVYYSSFFPPSYLLNCIYISDPSMTNACYNWQFVVDGAYADTGADQYTLTGGENVYFYFGQRYRVSTDQTTYELGQNVSSTLEEYDYTNNTFIPNTSQILGLLDSSGYIALATSSLDVNGQAVFSTTATGTYGVGLENQSPFGNYYWPIVNFKVVEPASTPPTLNVGGNCSTCGSTISNNIDIDQAISFLVTNQNSDGSFGSELLSDWVAIAFGAYTGTNHGLSPLTTYLTANGPAISSSTPVTEYERHAMALMSLGINPYTEANNDYISPIINAFDGTQIGDPNLVNDDIFAIFPLLKAGHSETSEIISDTVDFILSWQMNDGSWGSVDMTAAAVQALSMITPDTDITTAINSARNYLRNQQNIDGSIGSNIDSTAWSMQAIHALGENTTDSAWQKQNNSTGDYLYSNQEVDGGLRPDTDLLGNRIWSTAYSIPATLNLAWGDIMSSFEIPVLENQAVNHSATGDTFVGGNPESININQEEIPESNDNTTTTLDIVEENTESMEVDNVENKEEKTEVAKSGPQNSATKKDIITNTELEAVKTEVSANNQIEKEVTPEKTPRIPMPTEKFTNVQTIEANENSQPISKTTKGVFTVAASMTAAAGAYVAWRFLQTLI